MIWLGYTKTLISHRFAITAVQLTNSLKKNYIISWSFGKPSINLLAKYKIYLVRFRVDVEVCIKMAVFWDVALSVALQLLTDFFEKSTTSVVEAIYHYTMHGFNIGL
jgi:hypothetical protein